MREGLKSQEQVDHHDVRERTMSGQARRREDILTFFPPWPRWNLPCKGSKVKG